jgi:TadE-like protein
MIRHLVFDLSSVYDLSSRAKRGICSLLSIKPIARKLESTDGAEIAEAALVLPLVFMLLLGIIWFGRAFNIYSTITQAAQQGAITAARASCATCGDTLPAPALAENAIYAVLQADRLSTSQVQLPANPPNCGPNQPCNACASPPGGGCTPATGANALPVYVCQNVQLNPGATPAQCGAVVSFQYPFKFYLPFTSLNNQQIIMSAQAQSRMEN